MTSVDTEVVHGSHAAYRYAKCRCDVCRAAHAAYNKAYREANRERLDAGVRAWRAANAVHVRRYRRESYLANVEAEKARSKAWAETHPERRRMYEKSRRVRIDSAFIEHIDPMVVYERDEGICGIRHEPIGESIWHVDHIVPLVRNGEHSYANVQLAHAVCNLRKSGKLGDD